MTNILFLLSHTEKGGGEVVIYNLIKNLNRAQFRPFLGHLDFRKGAFIHEFKKLQVEPVDFRAGHLRNLPVTLAVIFRLRRFIRNNAIDLIFTSGAHNHIYASLAKMITGVPVVTYIMNYYQPHLKDNPLIMRAALKLRADYYILNSFFGLESLKKIITSDIPCKVVYHGIDKDFIYGEDRGGLVRNSLGLKHKNKLISCIARLQRWKGQDIFIRAAALIAKARPDARFCLVGGALFGMEEDYPDELSRLVDLLGLSGSCWLAGHQDNVRDWMSASDIIVHPLRVPDAGSVVVKEAMALGKPVVVTAYSNSFELIDDGVSGVLCPPDSAEDLASKIISLLDDEDLADKIGKAAKDVALRRFSVEAMAREIEGVVGEVISKTKKKCILFTLSSCKRSGHETAMRDIIQALDSEKYSPLVLFLCLNAEGSFPDELRDMGVDVLVRHVGRLREPVNVIRTVSCLRRLLKEKNVRLVFSAGGHNHVYSRIASLIARRPIVAHETFIFARYLWQNSPIHAFNFLLGADAYLSCGKLASETLRQASLWKPPIYYLPFMVDLNIFDYRKSGIAIRKSLNIPMSVFVFSMVARIQEWKGQDIFIEAALEILKEAPDTYFLIFGDASDQDKDYFDSIRERADSTKCRKQIIFAGYLAESVYAYAASDVICHCSKTAEPFGLVIIESFAMKKPVIATAIGGPIESVENGKDGYLIQPGSVDELVSVMRKCLKEKDHLAAMGEYGYQKAREAYSQQQFASGINSIVAKYIQT